jgi:amidase
VTQPCWRSARELARAIRRRELSSLELVDHFLARIERFNPALNAVVTLDAEGARAAAKRADEALARGERTGVLHGVPLTVKDAYEVAGMRTTCGANMFRDHVPARESDTTCAYPSRTMSESSCRESQLGCGQEL